MDRFDRLLGDAQRSVFGSSLRLYHSGEYPDGAWTDVIGIVDESVAVHDDYGSLVDYRDQVELPAGVLPDDSVVGCVVVTGAGVAFRLDSLLPVSGVFERVYIAYRQ